MKRIVNRMAKKTIAKNAGNSGRVSLSGPELEQFGSDVGDEVKIDVAESKEIAKAIITNSDHDAFIIVSKND